jgi:hypothetical protein
MKAEKLLKETFVIHFNEVGFNKSINRTETGIKRVNELLDKAKSLGFNFNDDEAVRFFETDFNSVMRESLERTNGLHYKLNPTSFNQSLTQLNNARIHYFGEASGSYEIANQVATMKESWKDRERKWFENVLTTEKGLEKFNLVKDLSKEIDEVLDSLNGDFRFSDIFITDSEGNTTPYPLEFDKL